MSSDSWKNHCFKLINKTIIGILKKQQTIPLHSLLKKCLEDTIILYMYEALNSPYHNLQLYASCALGSEHNDKTYLKTMYTYR